ncbi:MAG: DUF4325 domain-containing protein [Planctomycetes bacterium]|nr:DUF4325 domain-containing protein [Planctomycetota bacterium]
MGRQGKAKEIRRFLLATAPLMPGGLAAAAAAHFGITRQAAHRHLSDLVSEGVLIATGATRSREYRVAVIDQFTLNLNIDSHLEEDQVWQKDIKPHLDGVPDNVFRTLQYGFTEMLNNAKDHSGGNNSVIEFRRSAASVELWITDDGVGIFKKIQQALNLPDPRQSILELAKGKLTTDPQNHTGQGIFFTSRMFDRFVIFSGNLMFNHTQPDDDWLIEGRSPDQKGTTVILVTTMWSELTPKTVFDRYSDKEDYRFSKTHVPLSLAAFGSDQLVSRSQAKRVLARIDRFDEVILDFNNVEEIGQAFADEIFRVFARAHPHIKIITLHASPQIRQMISRAQLHETG